MLEMQELLGELIEPVRAMSKATPRSATRPCRAHKQKGPGIAAGALNPIEVVSECSEVQYFATTGPPQLNL